MHERSLVLRIGTSIETRLFMRLSSHMVPDPVLHSSPFMSDQMQPRTESVR